MKPKARSIQAFIWILGILFLCGSESYSANPSALSGTVRSTAEGRMEGVLVSAKREGSNMTVAVVSDSQGRYAFPGDRLQPGDYHLKIRAIGYDLDDPGVVKVESNKTAQHDLKLQKTKDLASQLTNAEWFLSNPEIKKRLIDGMRGAYPHNCIGCHAISVITKSQYDAQAWPSIVDRMWDYTEASIYQPGEVRVPDKGPRMLQTKPISAELAEFLSSINLSSRANGKWNFELKTLPRVKGRSTKVLITEYDLPRRECQPHDAVVASDGMVWYTDVGNGYLGRLNPRTGEVKEWPVPNPKPGSTIGTFDIKFDPEGNPWVGIAHQPGVAKFDKRTEKFTTWGGSGGGMLALSPDGTVWGRDSSNATKLDPKTGETVKYPFPKQLPGIPWSLRFYGVEADSQGNLYNASLQSGLIGELNAKTGQWALYPTPTPDSGPRRADMDRHDRFWFAEYYAGKIGMFDPKTKQFKEWDVPPTPWSGPYDVVVDKNGEVWAGGEFTDNVFRLNPANGQVTTYPLPTLEMNVQRIDVDNSTTPVTVWAGENHRAKIVKVEPLD